MEREHRSLIRAAPPASAAARSAERNASGARYGLFVTPGRRHGHAPAGPGRGPAAGDGPDRDAAVRRIGRPDPVSPWLVELLDGPPIEADAVVLTTEAHAAARLIDGHDPDLALQLRAIPYASSVIVNVAYRRDQVAHPLDGFGAVVPAIEGRSILAVSFLSVKFPGPCPRRHGPVARLRRRRDPARPVRARRRGDQGPRPRRAGRPARHLGRAPPDRGRPTPARDAAVHARPPRPRRRDPPPSRPASPARSWRATPSTASASPTASAPAEAAADATLAALADPAKPAAA